MAHGFVGLVRCATSRNASIANRAVAAARCQPRAVRAKSSVRLASSRSKPNFLFGLTRTEVIEFFFRTTVRVLVLLSLTGIPFLALTAYRYQFELKPAQAKLLAEKEKELLEEGRAKTVSPQ